MENTNSCASQQSAFNIVASSHGCGDSVSCVSGRSGDLQQTFLCVGIKLFSRGVELFNLKALQNIDEFLLSLNDADNKRIFGIGVVFNRLVFASVDTISSLQQFLGELGDWVFFAVVDLSILLIKKNTFRLWLWLAWVPAIELRYFQ